MRKIFGVFALMLVFVFAISFVAAEYSIDISGLKQDAYSVGDQVNFKVILLKDNVTFNDKVDVSFSDALNKKTVKLTVDSNKDSFVMVGLDFASSKWNVRAVYNTVQVERGFFVKEKSSVEFSIEGDKLIVKNIGNVRYTRTIDIKIGSEVKSYAQNIGVGEEKSWKLVAPEGTYDIEISDGENKLTRKSVQLFGTGNAIGAVSDSLQTTGLLGAPSDPNQAGSSLFSSTKISISLVFIAAVFGLGVLLLIERRMRRNSGN